MGINEIVDETTTSNREELKNAWIDERGVKYSADKKRLLRAPYEIKGKYTILYGTLVVCDHAFQGCSMLNEITISDSVRIIGDSAFYGCSGIKEITIPDRVTAIGDDAFHNCPSLKNVTIGNSVTSIGHSSFNECYNLAKVTIGNSLTSPDIQYTFGHIKYEVTKDNKSFCSRDGVLYSKDMTELMLFPRDLSIETFYIPDSVTSIGEKTFSYCKNLKEIFIPASVTSIPISSFNECSSLVKFKVSMSNKQYCSRDGVLYSKDMTKLILFPQDSPIEFYIIPDSVKNIGKDAFNGCKNIKEVTIGNSVTTIEDEAFNKCTNLIKVIISKSVAHIRYSAFKGCSSLAEYEVADDNEYFCLTDGVLYSKDMTELISFPKASLFEFFVVPKSVRTLGKDAFRDCTHLKEVAIGDSVTTIDDYTFYGCRSLTKVTIGNSVTNIKYSAFSGCHSLLWFEIAKDNRFFCTRGGVIYSKDLTELIRSPLSIEPFMIPNSVKIIGEGAFYGCKNIRELTLSNNVITIKDKAFGFCSNLKTISIGNAVTTIGNESFLDSGVKEVIIPKSVTFIGCGAFSGCTNLEKVVIPESVKYIGAQAFYSCNQLNKVSIYNSAHIGAEAFFGCQSLYKIVLPDSVTSIGELAFAECTQLSEVMIGNSAKDIGYDLFYGCPLLSRVYILNPNPPLNDNIFHGVKKYTCELQVPKGSKEAYSKAEGWKDFKNIVEIDLTAIKDIDNDEPVEVIGYYNTDGTRLPNPQKGVNIVLYSDGTKKKILIQ